MAETTAGSGRVFRPGFCHREKERGARAYGISVLSDQRRQPWQHLRHHRPGLHHGLWHRQDAELRPRRRHHGGGLCVLLHHFLRREQPAGGEPLRSGLRRGHPAVGAGCHGGVHGAGRDHRGAGLPSPAPGRFPGGADHRHRRQLLFAERRPAPLRRQPGELHPGHQRPADPLRRQAADLLRGPFDRGGLHRHHARPDRLPERAGWARPCGPAPRTGAPPS